MKIYPTPQLQKLDSEAAAAVLYIGLWLWTKDMLISYDIIPGDILK